MPDFHLDMTRQSPRKKNKPEEIKKLRALDEEGPKKNRMGEEEREGKQKHPKKQKTGREGGKKEK